MLLLLGLVVVVDEGISSKKRSQCESGRRGEWQWHSGIGMIYVHSTATSSDQVAVQLSKQTRVLSFSTEITMAKTRTQNGVVIKPPPSKASEYEEYEIDDEDELESSNEENNKKSAGCSSLGAARD